MPKKRYDLLEKLATLVAIYVHNQYNPNYQDNLRDIFLEIAVTLRLRKNDLDINALVDQRNQEGVRLTIPEIFTAIPSSFEKLYNDIISIPGFKGGYEGLVMATVCGNENKIMEWKDYVKDFKIPVLKKIFEGEYENISIHGVQTFLGLLNTEDFTSPFDNKKSLIDFAISNGWCSILEEAIRKGFDVKTLDIETPKGKRGTYKGTGNKALDDVIKGIRDENYHPNVLCNYPKTFHALVKNGAKIINFKNVSTGDEKLNATLTALLKIGKVADGIVSSENLSGINNLSKEFLNEGIVSFLSTRCKALTGNDKYTNKYNLLYQEIHPTDPMDVVNDTILVGKRKNPNTDEGDDNKKIKLEEKAEFSTTPPQLSGEIPHTIEEIDS